MKSPLRLVVPVAVVFVSSLALAQPSSPPPMPPLEQPPQAIERVPTEADVSAAEETESMRLRGGVTAGIGLFAPGPSFMFGISGRFGVQVTRMLAVDLELSSAAGFGLGLTTGANGATVSVTGAAYYQLALLGEVLFSDHLFVNLGPAVANGGWAGVAATGSTSGGASGSATTYGVGGWLPGGTAKLGFMAGRRNELTGKRHGFSISIDVNVLFGDRLTVTGSGSTGGGSGSVSLGLGAGIGTMLMLGYAWK